MNNLKLKTVLSFSSLLFLFLYSASSVSAVTYSYDKNGNLTSDGTTCYVYNDANQLSTVKECTSGKTIAQYVYDFQGNRIVKKEYAAGNLKQTVYSPTDEHETKKIASNGAIEKTTYYKAKDEIVAKKNPDGSKTYFLNDHLGSISILSNQSGAVIETTTYDPFGEVKSGGTKSKFQYTGQEKDSETKLNYYGARYYDSKLGRFIQADPIIQNIYDPQSLNRYSYVRNNPLKYTDPTGNFFVIDDATVLIGASALVGGYVAISNPEDTRAALTFIAKETSELVSQAAEGISNIGNSISNMSGSKPVANNSSKNTSSGGSPKTPLKNPFNDMSKSAIAGTINYTYHALNQRMAESNISKDSVVQALQNGIRIEGADPNTSIYQLGSKLSNTGRGLRVVIDDITNNIITVTDKGTKFNPK